MCLERGAPLYIYSGYYRNSSSRWQQIFVMPEYWCPGFCLRIQESAPPAPQELTILLTMDSKETSSLKMLQEIYWLGRLELIASHSICFCVWFWKTRVLPYCEPRFGLVLRSFLTSPTLRRCTGGRTASESFMLKFMWMVCGLWVLTYRIFSCQHYH